MWSNCRPLIGQLQPLSKPVNLQRQFQRLLFQKASPALSSSHPVFTHQKNETRLKQTISFPNLHLSHLHSSSLLRDKEDDEKEKKDEKKPGIIQQFKLMWKDYWYVMLPVHCVTSAGWFSLFFFAIKSGVDVPGILAQLGTSEAYLEKIRNSEWANVALSYACYKVATPARYTVTIGGTTWTIKYLTDLGYLKTSKEISQRIKDKKDDAKDKVQEEVEKAWEKYGKRKKKE